jgi:hypothetical protein
MPSQFWVQFGVAVPLASTKVGDGEEIVPSRYLIRPWPSISSLQAFTEQ